MFEQTSWLLFLKYLDDLEQSRAINATLGERKQSVLQKTCSGELTLEQAEVAVEEAKQ